MRTVRKANSRMLSTWNVNVNLALVFDTLPPPLPSPLIKYNSGSKEHRLLPYKTPRSSDPLFLLKRGKRGPIFLTYPPLESRNKRSFKLPLVTAALSSPINQPRFHPGLTGTSQGFLAHTSLIYSEHIAKFQGSLHVLKLENKYILTRSLPSSHLGFVR
jgi:hypothetical protein